MDLSGAAVVDAVPRRRHRRRRLAIGCAALASATTVALGTTASAAVSTPVEYVSQPTATGLCNAVLFTTNTVKADDPFVFGVFQNQDSGFSCDGWLMRSTDNGASWQQLSGVHSLNSNPDQTESATTYNYYDGPGYLAKACFQYTSWSGAAVHCTNPW